ncbi:MAG: amidohydrolase [Pseudomonadota bacterium]
MRYLSGRLFLLSVIVISLLTGCVTHMAPDTASVVLRGGAVYAMDGHGNKATAIALRADRILYVGSDDQAAAYIGDQTKILELDGKMVLPGFIDGHAHPPGRELAALNTLVLNALEPNLSVYRKAIKDYSNSRPDMPILFGSGLQLNAFTDDTLSKKFLDNIVSDRPVLIKDSSFHGELVNSIALEMSGITKETSDPPGGKIYRDEYGEPTGYLSDAGTLLHPDLQRGPEVSHEMYLRAWRQYEDVSLAKGITAVTNALPQALPSPVVWQLLDEHIKSGNARMRVNVLSKTNANHSSEATIKELRNGQQFVSDWQMVRGVKIVLDGVPEGKSAYLLQPYAPSAELPANDRGTPMWEKESFNEYIADLDAAGFQVQTHSMGDASVRMFVDAVENAYMRNSARDARHTVIHANLIDPADIERMAKMDIYAAMSPIWSYGEPVFSALELQMLGKKRFDQEYALRDMAQAGIRMTGSADQPVTPDDRPLFGIETGVTRGSPYVGEQNDPRFFRGQSQSLSVAEMLEMYTINGARQMFMDDLIGSLEPGKKADLVILERDITQIDPVDISETRIVATIVNGETVYSNNELFDVH